MTTKLHYQKITLLQIENQPFLYFCCSSFNQKNGKKGFYSQNPVEKRERIKIY